MPGRGFVTGTAAKEKFTGKERDAETGLDYFGARYYMPAMGRWSTVDPLAARGPGISPYAYSFNNPISFFDPNGEWPYTFYVRSFHPSASFGGGFHGDNRGFSTSLDVTSRVQQRFTLDTDRRALLDTRTWSDPSSHPLLPWSPQTENPRGGFSAVSSSMNSLGSEMLSFNTTYSGSNPLVPRSPAIDLDGTFSITENLEHGLLSIAAVLTGDNFPATEAFIADTDGNSLFLGVGSYEGTPWRLWGDNNRGVINVNLQVRINSEGIFQGVIYNDQEYTLDEWNKLAGSSNPNGN